MYVPSSERVEFVEGLIVQLVYDDRWDASALSWEVFVKFPKRTDTLRLCDSNLLTCFKSMPFIVNL